MTRFTRGAGLAGAALMAVLAGCADIPDAFGTNQAAVSGTSIGTDKTTYQLNEPITVTFTGMSGATTDWIALANASDPDDTYLAYADTLGAVSGSHTFSGLPAGNYELRAYFDWTGTQSFEVMARTAFAVEAPPVGVTVAASAFHYTSGSPVTINYTGLAGTATDWVAIAQPGSPLTSFVTYQYTGGTADGSVQFAGLPNGPYVARTFNSDSYELVLESAQFAVGNIVTTSASSYSAGESISVSFAGLPVSPTNWVSVAAVGAADADFAAYQYVSTASGQVTFGALPGGTYEARVYLNDTYELYAKATFTVLSAATPDVETDKASYVEGEIVSTSYTFSGNVRDWVGISLAGSADTSFVAYAYVDADGTSAFGGSLAAGNYEARLYSNDSFTVVASALFTVTAAAAPAATDVTTTQATYSASDTVVVSYTSLGGSQDWIAVALAGSPDTAYVQYVYTTSADGQVSFTGLAPGSYEARAYKNDSFTVEDRTTFEVQ